MTPRELDITEVEAFAKEVATTLTSRDVLCLVGPLGAGKTTFSQHLIRCLTGDPSLEVTSPTYTLVQEYQGPYPIFHYDLYRLEAPEELEEIGFNETLSQGLCLIEWPERAGRYLPHHRKTLTIKYANDASKRLFCLE